MSDRLPAPMNEPGRRDLHIAERASATPVVANEPARKRDATAGTPKNAEPARPANGAPLPVALVDVQHWMVAQITAPADATTDGASIARVLTKGPRLSADERFDVYRAGYYTRLLECLRDDYPVLADTIGEEGFDALGRAYIDTHPSTNPNLNFFGRHMSSLCKSVDVAAIDSIRGFAVDLAALEWAMVEVLHAEASAPFDLAALSAIPIEAWATARLVPSDAVRLLRFDHPVNPYYQACRTSTRPAELPRAAKSATVIYRSELTIWRMDLTPAMTRVLDALLSGARVGDALDRIGLDEADADALAEAERSVMLWFREWVNGGMFSAVILDPAPT